ncbi:hypothetical protein BDC45DRAFT_536197 [Circinella umbellata]|nr:hypothetical protein BDC45DRAFT_536197 [Circinella umbellata]
MNSVYLLDILGNKSYRDLFIQYNIGPTHVPRGYKKDVSRVCCYKEKMFLVLQIQISQIINLACKDTRLAHPNLSFSDLMRFFSGWRGESLLTSHQTENQVNHIDIFSVTNNDILNVDKYNISTIYSCIIIITTRCEFRKESPLLCYNPIPSRCFYRETKSVSNTPNYIFALG